jgi:hypothetical protein
MEDLKGGHAFSINQITRRVAHPVLHTNLHTIFGAVQTFSLFLVWNQATRILFLLSLFETWCSVNFLMFIATNVQYHVRHHVNPSFHDTVNKRFVRSSNRTLLPTQTLWTRKNNNIGAFHLEGRESKPNACVYKNEGRHWYIPKQTTPIQVLRGLIVLNSRDQIRTRFCFVTPRLLVHDNLLHANLRVLIMGMSLPAGASTSSISNVLVRSRAHSSSLILIKPNLTNKPRYGPGRARKTKAFGFKKGMKQKILQLLRLERSSVVAL